MRGDAVVGLRVEIVAVGDEVDGVGINAAVVHERLAGGGVSICTGDGYKIAVVISPDGNAGGVRLARLFPLAREPVADQTVPCVAEGVVEGCGKEDVLIGLLAGIGHPVERVGAGKIGGDIGVARRDAEAGVAVERIAEVRSRCDVVVLVVRDRVLSLEVAEGSVVVELVEGPAELDFIAVGAEGASITFVEQRREGRGAVRSVEAHQAGGGIGAPENAVGPAVGFDVCDAGAGDGGQVEAAADVFDGDTVEQNLVGVGVASANEDGGEATALARSARRQIRAPGGAGRP